MASLTEVYEGGAGGTDRRRLYAGLALFAAGAVLTVVGIVVATAAGNSGAFGMGVYAAREVAGVLAGVGLPATFLGAMAVLPRAARHVRVTAVLGSAVAVVGVLLFADVYPGAWFANAWVVVPVYFVGALTTFWCLFVSVATFKARNNPGGTVDFEVRKQGRTRVVEVPASLRGLGGVGLLGSAPDGNAETQTARSSGSAPTGGPGATTDGGARDAGPSSVGGDGRVAEPHVDSDRGTTTESIAEPGTAPAANARRSRRPDDDAQVLDDEAVLGDAYCGNCAQFSYVRTDEGLQPYCGLHGEMMDDMEACSQWEPNR